MLRAFLSRLFVCAFLVIDVNKVLHMSEPKKDGCDHFKTSEQIQQSLQLHLHVQKWDFCGPLCVGRGRISAVGAASNGDISVRVNYPTFAIMAFSYLFLSFRLFAQTRGQRRFSCHDRINERMGLLPPPRDNITRKQMHYTPRFGFRVLIGELIRDGENNKKAVPIEVVVYTNAKYLPLCLILSALCGYNGARL